VLPAGSTLMANEPNRQRASVLSENVQKWGHPGVTVTNNYPREYRKSKLLFDIILCDVPCSGEGMFRKDPKAVGEWSLQNVEKCWRLQREIVSDAWHCLKPGGLMIYSTCTLNTLENEENVSWMLAELDGCEVLPIPTDPSWNITGSLLPGFTQPVYRFIPGMSRSEGLFMVALGKGRGDDFRGYGSTGARGRENTSALNILPPSISRTPENPHPLTYSQALSYLRGEALTLPPDTPRGIVEVGFMGHRLGTVKNIGTRANNLYPKEWRIKTTHIPNEYEAILRHS